MSFVLWTAFKRGRLGAPASTAVCCRFWAESRIPCCIVRCRHRRGHGTLLSGHGHRDTSTAIQALPSTYRHRHAWRLKSLHTGRGTERMRASRCCDSDSRLAHPIVSCSLRPHRSVCVCGDWTPRHPAQLLAAKQELISQPGHSWQRHCAFSHPALISVSVSAVPCAALYSIFAMVAMRAAVSS